MHILAIESSTPHASIALLRDGAILGISEWMSSRDAGNRPWEHASAILSQNRLSPDSVDLYAAGLGPGSYSGLRVSLMAIRGMAMPDYRSVCGVSSGEALAAALLVDQDIGTLAVVGDARRNRVWFALFERAADGTATIMGDYELTSCDELRTKLPAGTTIASPDIPSISERNSMYCRTRPFQQLHRWASSRSKGGWPALLSIPYLSARSTCIRRSSFRPAQDNPACPTGFCSAPRPHQPRAPCGVS